MDYLKLAPVELDFINELNKQLSSNGYDPVYLRINRTSDNILNFRLTGCQIGRVKLQGLVTRMQVITLDSVHWYDGLSFDACVGILPRWIDYIGKSAIYDPARPIYY